MTENNEQSDISVVSDDELTLTSDELDQVSGGFFISNLLLMMADLRKSTVANIRC
jgi:hypothetical protein